MFNSHTFNYLLSSVPPTLKGGKGTLPETPSGPKRLNGRNKIRVIKNTYIQNPFSRATRDGLRDRHIQNNRRMVRKRTREDRH